MGCQGVRRWMMGRGFGRMCFRVVPPEQNLAIIKRRMNATAKGKVTGTLLQRET